MALFKKPKQPAPSELQTQAAALAEAEKVLAAARGVAAEAASLEASRVAAAEKAAAEARTTLAAAEEAERRRPAEEKLEERRTRLAAIDGEVKEGLGWLAASFSERESVVLEVEALRRETNQRPVPLQLDAGPHDVRLGEAGRAFLTVKWPGKTSYGRIKA
jgi:hypothetical protein